MHTWLSVGIADADLGLQPVRITEEQAQDVAEVGHETIGRTTGEQPVPDLVERLGQRTAATETRGARTGPGS